MRSEDAIISDYDSLKKIDAWARQQAMKPTKEQWVRWIAMRANAKSTGSKPGTS